MSAQVAHFGLVAGMSWVPVQLLCVLRLSQPRRMPSRLAWTGILAGTFGLTILAGEPRAIDDAGLIVLLYAAWQIARLGRRFGGRRPSRSRPGWRWASASGRFSGCPAWPSSARPSGA